jgi:hypothetical protein
MRHFWLDAVSLARHAVAVIGRAGVGTKITGDFIALAFRVTRGPAQHAACPWASRHGLDIFFRIMKNENIIWGIS